MFSVSDMSIAGLLMHFPSKKRTSAFLLPDSSPLIEADLTYFTVLESGVTEDLAWELEHGFRKGVEDFYDCVGI